MIKHEMTGESTSPVVVALFSEDDFVDKPTPLLIAGGQPRDFDTTEFPLQHLEQRHEIPHGEDVVFHEKSQRINAINFAVDAVFEQCVLEGRQLLFDLVKLIQGSFLCFVGFRRTS